MRTHSVSIIILFFTSIPITVHSQTSYVYDLEKRLIRGDKRALFEMAPYFDSEKPITEFLGYHKLNTTEARIAKRIVVENCDFIPQEIAIRDSTTTKQFSDFLSHHQDSIVFSAQAQAFLITPLEKREARFETRELTANRKHELDVKVKELQKVDWVKSAGIDVFIYMKDSKALLLIASEFYKRRYRFNLYPYDLSEFTDLLQGLLGAELAVENERKELTWHPDKEFYRDASRNLLIYFSKHYQEYQWDDQRATFFKSGILPAKISQEDALFQLLSSETDSIAMNAFIRLTTSSPQKVNQLSDEYSRADIETNFSLPTFPYRFLDQLVVLTEYCNKSEIDFRGPVQLKNSVLELKKKLTFRERRMVEDSLVRVVSLSEITTFEYWSMVYGKSFELTYSAGRILDKFYSRHWKELTADEKQLTLYLKKSALFDRLGIIGICNNYLKKFVNAEAEVLVMLNSIHTNDPDVLSQIEKAKAMCLVKLKRPHITEKEFDSNRDFPVINVEKEIAKVIQTVKDDSDRDFELRKVLTKINYSQIETTLHAVENISFRDTRSKYSFVADDFGFFMADFYSEKGRQEFLKRYTSLSEYELYSTYLEEAGIDYRNPDHSLDYDKIFELLKHDIVVAFVGGGGSVRDNEVYALIKLLELTYKTTLGYPRKRCNSIGLYGCDSIDRAKEWMQYFIDNKLLKATHSDPISFRDDQY